MDSLIKSLQEQIESAKNTGSSIAIRGQGSKQFYGNAEQGELLSTTSLNGIVEYDPSELVITAKAGTPLSELTMALDEQNQMLAFEPLMIDGQGTVGGAVATGLAGSRRPWSGGVRDYVLGLHLINGRGEYCRFGGQVMKNVAGYDVSRLMVGAMGCLGLITQVSFKVLPKPQVLKSVVLDMPMAPFIELVSGWKSKMNPVTGVAHDGEKAYLRLEGFGRNVDDFVATHSLVLDEDQSFWTVMQTQKHGIFNTDQPLWRLSLPQWTQFDEPGLSSLMEWAGGQYWISGSDRATLEARVKPYGGHVCGYRNTSGSAFDTPSAMQLQLHQKLKAAYDPQGIFNPGRLYSGL